MAETVLLLLRATAGPKCIIEKGVTGIWKT